MFIDDINKVIVSGQSRSLIVCGNIYDIFWNGNEFVPLIRFLNEKITDHKHIVYELNGPIRFVNSNHKIKIKESWVRWRLGDSTSIVKQLTNTKHAKEIDSLRKQIEDKFESDLLLAVGQPTVALEFLRQIAFCANEDSSFDSRLLITIEAADLMLPCGNDDVSSLQDKQLHRISIVHDWITDPAFIRGKHSVILISESRGLIHNRISKMPQVISVNIPAPNADDRLQMLKKEFTDQNKNDQIEEAIKSNIIASSASLSLYAFRQLLKVWDGSQKMIVEKVEEYIQSQLGEDVVEFIKPTHTLDDCVGFTKLKTYLRNVLIPRINSAKGQLTGAGVAGAIGGGKTFIFLGLASELSMPVLLLKNIRSQWFGITDVIIERLRRILFALDKGLIFLDEADTQFGGLDENTHETERRLTGKIQAMMSDPLLKGKIYWLLMTARIHRLSPDIRRPGRAGDLIIPVFDPTGEDRIEFISWVLKDVKIQNKCAADDIVLIQQINDNLSSDYSAASFASLKSNLEYIENFESRDELINEIQDIIQPSISLTRRYQTLQAMINCTRKSLLPNPNVTDDERKSWELEIHELEAKGIK